MALSLPLSGGPSERRSGDRLCYALTGAKVIAAPGRVIDPGIVVIRGAVFEAVGAQGQVLIPADARVFDVKGKALHAAFIDPYVPADRLAGRHPRGPSDDEEAAELTPGTLSKAGVRVAFSDGSDASNARNLPHQVAAAVAFGFPREKAVAAMTLEPARILGAAARVGSLEPGKDATLIVTDGDILDLRTHVLAAYLDGRPLDLTDKQKRLYERYKNRPKAGAR
jgi:imidazolonepropionase-like amidohydrolase